MISSLRAQSTDVDAGPASYNVLSLRLNVSGEIMSSLTNMDRFW